ncbi:hypothetical protein [Mucilaginibacter arboris]|uniref:PBCV-specific basic adaptor domain-containing protein n=1 Tax=Mucilaginibacter arboris TaxID=2682090 RepID=A0A7K1T136_9SPHI|nr:hypothetical protein [Mucilaginibacter arboris]MVN23265.1 hypothetical protein [Mucilaginibacter arboris]
MKKIKALLLSAAVLFAVQSFAQNTGKGKVGTAINKAGNKTAELAVKGASAVADKKYDGKVGPGGQVIYINKNSKYYYVNKKGAKVYVSKAKLKDAPTK